MCYLACLEHLIGPVKSRSANILAGEWIGGVGRRRNLEIKDHGVRRKEEGCRGSHTATQSDTK